jgi:hypothetical protein
MGVGLSMLVVAFVAFFYGHRIGYVTCRDGVGLVRRMMGQKPNARICRKCERYLEAPRADRLCIPCVVESMPPERLRGAVKMALARQATETRLQPRMVPLLDERTGAELFDQFGNKLMTQDGYESVHVPGGDLSELDRQVLADPRREEDCA